MNVTMKISKCPGERLRASGSGAEWSGRAWRFPIIEGIHQVPEEEAREAMMDALRMANLDETKPSMAMAYTSLAAQIKRQLDRAVGGEGHVSHAKQ